MRSLPGYQHMWIEHLDLLACPRSGLPLEVTDVERSADDGEIIEATLVTPDGTRYPVRNGIPRFTEDTGYNASWDYKWTSLDGGAGHNYRVIDRQDPAHDINDLFDRNAHGGRAHERARGGTALDLGCGIGQCSVRLLREYEPERMVSMDLTRGVDVFRGIVSERYPELRRRLLLVQGDALNPPLRSGAFDYVLSLGVLMHTGDTRLALRRAVELLRPHGHLNVWLYASETFPSQAREPGRRGPKTPLSLLPLQLRYTIVQLWLELFRRLTNPQRMRLVRAFSGPVWYRLSTLRVVRVVPGWIFPTNPHPDEAYRVINNYDGYVNDWSDTWSEHELLPMLLDSGLVLLGLSDWRLGIWGVRDPAFRDRETAPGRSAGALEDHADNGSERRDVASDSDTGQRRDQLPVEPRDGHG
jgi:SAM-dependent methyltransferase